jgi:hypothetical protein
MTDETGMTATADRIRAILVADWDPLGVAETPGAHDSYDTEVEEVAELLSDPAISQARIANYLRWAETQILGLQRRPGIATAAAGKLMALRAEAGGGSDDPAA